MVLAAELLDRLAAPARGWRRSMASLPPRQLGVMLLFGLGLGLTGNIAIAAMMPVLLALGCVTASNAKYRLLGEPLIFTDFLVVTDMLRAPGFYLNAVPTAAWVLVPLVAVGLGWLILEGLTLDASTQAAGVALVAVCGGGLIGLPNSGPYRRLVTVPDLGRDVRRHGLFTTMLLHGMRWRAQRDPPPCIRPGPSVFTEVELVVVVQCESFTDPADYGGHDPLPGLAGARSRAALWGRLDVSGFGAYTMRTEYGVLFGRSETQLGFRCFNPFLTASGERSYALPIRLRPRFSRAVFLHPHDLRFYQRDRLMPSIGFDTILGPEAFPGQGAREPAGRAQGPHVADAVMGALLAAEIDAADQPTLLYAVTMENHGPWTTARLEGCDSPLGAYHHHLRNSDTMLQKLIDHLDAHGRPALLAFFGDHRPAIPGSIEHGQERHTPFVLLRFPRDASNPAAEGCDLSPAELHHAILDRCVRTAGGEGPVRAAVS